MRIGYARISKADGRQVRDLQRDAPTAAKRSIGVCSNHSSSINRGQPHPRKGDRMAWFILVLAGLFEVGWAIGLKYTEGFTRWWPTVWTAVAMIISLWLLGLAMKSLPIGTAYSVWVGVGSVGTVILGIVLLGEPVNAARLISIMLIIAGIIGLKLATPV
jgi:quaternary ammonium compound-resistance protein SugE